MKPLNNLRDLLLEQMRDLLAAEQQQLMLLPAIINEASDSELKEAIEKHLQDTRAQVVRMQQSFEILHELPGNHENKSITSLLKRTLQLAGRSNADQVRDAALITALQYLIHYEIAGYGTSCAYCSTLEDAAVGALLHKTLE